MVKLVLGAVIVPIVLVVMVAVVGSGDDPAPMANGAVNTAAASEIPSPFLSAYRQASTSCGGLDWRVLAGIGWVESGHGRGRTVGPEGDVLPPIVGPAIDGRAGFARIPDSGSSDGWAHARGPMQFLTTTWRGVARLGPGRPAGASPSIDNILDAAATAAAYLCGASGSLGDVRAAILRYNNATSYALAVGLLLQEELGRLLVVPEVLPRGDLIDLGDAGAILLDVKDAPGERSASLQGTPGGHGSRGSR